MTDPTSRAQRSDARRNRERLLAAAREAFATSTPQAASLDGIAQAAGVGSGTLYRHFPTRQALVAAVYEAELEALVRLVPDQLAADPPEVALRRWMDRYGDFVAAKRGLADALRQLPGSEAPTSGSVRPRVVAAVRELLGAGAAAGTLRADVAAEDVVTSLVGTFLATADAGDPGQAGRVLDLLVDGLRVRPPADSGPHDDQPPGPRRSRGSLSPPAESGPGRGGGPGGT